MSTLENGRSFGSAASMAGETRSTGLEKDCSSTGRKASSLRAVVVEKAAHVARIGRRSRAISRSSAVEIRGGPNLAAALEDEVVLRVETPELDMILQPLAAGCEDVREDARIEEEGRADIELIAAGRTDRAGTPADRRFAFEHGDGQPSRASSMAAASPPGPAPTTATCEDGEDSTLNGSPRPSQDDP